MYQPGDVVFCKFPYEENPKLFVDRPGLILSLLADGRYRIVKITKVNKSDKYPGLWIKMNSSEGRAMRLSYDSFINLSRIAVVPEFGIRRYLGHCPLMNEIKKICEKHHLDY